jgi:hypothetical protein
MSMRLNGRGRPQELRGKRKSDPRARSTSAQPSRTAPGAQTVLRGQARQAEDGVSGRPRSSSTRNRSQDPETRANPATPATERQQPQSNADPHTPEIFTPSRRPERHQRLFCGKPGDMTQEQHDQQQAEAAGDAAPAASATGAQQANRLPTYEVLARPGRNTRPGRPSLGRLQLSGVTP